jgi:hypothetical protein
MGIEAQRGVPERRRGAHEDPADVFDLEERLARLERHYAEATMRFRRARDEYHMLVSHASMPDSATAAAHGRYQAARKVCDDLRREIDLLEARLG